MKRFVVKKVKHYKTPRIIENNNNTQPQIIEKVTKKKNVKKNEEVEIIKAENVMDTKEKIELANAILGDDAKVKRVKKEKGIIERAESSMTILTEDNRELLKD
ncbi:MAG: hypothetical protein IKT40_07400 [Bacilli bacterium]|nr:hypothetical protein [Bacilli bacterium]